MSIRAWQSVREGACRFMRCLEHGADVRNWRGMMTLLGRPGPTTLIPSRSADRKDAMSCNQLRVENTAERSRCFGQILQCKKINDCQGGLRSGIRFLLKFSPLLKWVRRGFSRTKLRTEGTCRAFHGVFVGPESPRIKTSCERHLDNQSLVISDHGALVVICSAS